MSLTISPPLRRLVFCTDPALYNEASRFPVAYNVMRATRLFQTLSASGSTRECKGKRTNPQAEYAIPKNLTIRTGGSGRSYHRVTGTERPHRRQMAANLASVTKTQASPFLQEACSKAYADYVITNMAPEGMLTNVGSVKSRIETPKLIRLEVCLQPCFLTGPTRYTSQLAYAEDSRLARSPGRMGRGTDSYPPTNGKTRVTRSIPLNGHGPTDSRCRSSILTLSFPDDRVLPLASLLVGRRR